MDIFLLLLRLRKILTYNTDETWRYTLQYYTAAQLFPFCIFDKT